MDSNSKQEDVFDQLPDHLLLLIFNKLHDAKSLCFSMTVCNRFRSIIPQTDTVFLTVPRRNIPFLLKHKEESDGRCDSKSSARKRFLKSLINKVVLKPLRFIVQIVAGKSSSCECECECEDDDNNSILSPKEALKNFDDIRSLHIELPSQVNEIGSNGSDALLKWKAEFGNELQSCVILAATSFGELNVANSDHQQRDSSLNNDEELKVRVMWTISCLIAASSRHYMLQKLIGNHEKLESLVITDANKQGKICMQKQQIEEVVNCMSKLSEAVVPLERTRVPALRTKMWYAPVLELPASGCVMKGATLMVIRPVGGAEQSESDRDLVMGAFDEAACDEAVSQMMKKKKTYTLEMNSF